MRAEPQANLSADQRASSDERFVLLTVALGTMLAPLNSTMIAVALPGIMEEFDAGVGQATWLVTAYLAAMASLQPLGGKIGDRFGRRPLVLGGLGFFGLASVGAALAPDLWTLLAFRVLQAIAGGLVIPNGLALARQIVPEERRGRAFGLIGAGIGIAAASGPPLGGVLVETASWRAIFYINFALILPALALGWKWLPAGDGARRGGGFDLTGAIGLPIILAGAAGILMSIGRGVGAPVLAAGGLGLLAFGVVFIHRELRHPDPVFQPRLFRNRAFASAGGGIGLGNMAMYTLLLSVPILLATRDGASGLETGLVLTALSASMIVLAPFGGLLADRFGRKWPTVVGLGILTAGTIPIALAGAEVTLPALVAGLAVAGIGLGVATPGLQTTAVESVHSDQAGVASGLYSTCRYMGSILGPALLAGLVTTAGSDVEGMGTIFVIVVAAALLATVSALGLRARPSIVGRVSNPPLR